MIARYYTENLKKILNLLEVAKSEEDTATEINQMIAVKILALKLADKLLF